MIQEEVAAKNSVGSAPDTDPTLLTLPPLAPWRLGDRLTPRDPLVGLAATPAGVVVAPDNAAPLLVRTADLPAFVLAHSHLRWVAVDAAGAFWRLHDALVTAGGPAVGVLWKVVEDGRLRDPAILDALLQINNGSTPLLRPLAAIAADVGVTPGPGGMPGLAAAAAYRALWKRAVAIPTPTDVLPDARDRFGLLSETVQVKKAVALAAITRLGVRVDRGVLAAAGPAGAQLLRHVPPAGEPVLRPAYGLLTVTGRTSCSAPGFQNVPRAGLARSGVVPRPGYLLLVVDYAAAELRALAAVCLRRYGRSALADVLRAGGDPHAHTAASILGLDPAAFEATVAAGGPDADRLRGYRRAAKAVNFGVPGGLGNSALGRQISGDFGVTLADADVAHWRATLTGSVYPELGTYLADAAPGVVATLTGRVRGGVGYTQALNTPFQGLAADGAGLALFELVRAGFRVVGFVHDEFLIEVPDRGGFAALDEILRAVAVAEAGMQEVLGGVPAACSWRLARRWGSAGPHSVVGDRVVPAP